MAQKTIYSCVFATLVLLFILLVSSCQSSDTTSVEIRFHPIEPVIDSAWLKIDDHLFIHTPHDFEWRSQNFFPAEEGEGDFCYLPTSRVFFYHPENQEKRVMEKITNFEICKRLGNKLSSIKEDTELTYKIVNPTEYLVNGILRIQRSDNKKITFSHSDDNPVTMIYKRVE